MTIYPLRKCISLPSNLYDEDCDTIVDGTGVGPYNRLYLQQSQSVWVKLWINWRDLMPSQVNSATECGNYLNNDPAAKAKLQRLDYRIATARGAGRAVNLGLVHEYPLWASTQTVANLTPAQQAAQRGPTRQDYWRYPTPRTTDSPFGWFLSYLFNRYSPTWKNNQPFQTYVDAFEICNEPNLLMWPQTNVWSVISDMFFTAEALAAYWSGPNLLGPGTVDGSPETENQYDPEHGAYTGWRYFTSNLLGVLQNFRPRVYFGWSQHNYGDVARGTNIAAAARDLLYQQQWKGPSADRAMWLTEGGYVLSAVNDTEKARQKNLVRSAFDRMKNTSDVYLFTQHKIADRLIGETYRSGMIDGSTSSSYGAARPLLDEWKVNMPGAPL